MIVINKRTKEKLELTYEEFFTQFYKEIKEAYDSYRSMTIKKSYFKKIDENTMESDFYNDLQWNFNNLNNCNWYIKKL